MSVLPPPRSLSSRSEIVLRHTGPTSISVLIVLGEPGRLRGRAPPEPHTAQRSAEGRQKGRLTPGCRSGQQRTSAARPQDRIKEPDQQLCESGGVARGGVEPPTFRFSGGRSYQLSYLAGHRPRGPVMERPRRDSNPRPSP